MPNVGRHRNCRPTLFRHFLPLVAAVAVHRRLYRLLLRLSALRRPSASSACAAAAAAASERAKKSNDVINDIQILARFFPVWWTRVDATDERSGTPQWTREGRQRTTEDGTADAAQRTAP